MKRLKLTKGDKILVAVYLIILGGSILECFFKKQEELSTHINLCIWIFMSMLWFFLFKVAESRTTRIVESIGKTPEEVNNKAMSSAPSSLSTYEKGVYEEGFKDGVNYIKYETYTSF